MLIEHWIIPSSSFWMKQTSLEKVNKMLDMFLSVTLQNQIPFIVMVSTPPAPDGLFDSIEKEPEDSCIYKRILLDYTYGLDKIYTRQEIEKAKISPSFEREYNLKYLGGIGNIFHTIDIDAAIEKGKVYDPANPVAMYPKSMGIDPAYGSSSFGIVVTQFVDGQVQILHAEEYKRPDFNEMLEKAWNLIVKYTVQKNIH